MKILTTKAGHQHRVAYWNMGMTEEDYKFFIDDFKGENFTPPKPVSRISFEFDPKFWQTPCVAYNHHCQEIEIQVLCFGMMIYIGRERVKRPWSIKNFLYR